MPLALNVCAGRVCKLELGYFCGVESLKGNGPHEVENRDRPQARGGPWLADPAPDGLHSVRGLLGGPFSRPRPPKKVKSGLQIPKTGRIGCQENGKKRHSSKGHFELSCKGANGIRRCSKKCQVGSQTRFKSWQISPEKCHSRTPPLKTGAAPPKCSQRGVCEPRLPLLLEAASRRSQGFLEAGGQSRAFAHRR